MAHAGQELAFGLCRFQRPMLRDGQLLVGRFQRFFALLDLHEHLVELVDQETNLVLSALNGANRIILLVGHHPGGVCQRQDGFRDHPLQLRRDDPNDPNRTDQNDRHDSGESLPTSGHFIHRVTNIESANPLAAKNDRLEDDQLAVLITSPVRLRLGWRR